jgi:hypothetical protein
MKEVNEEVEIDHQKECVKGLPELIKKWNGGHKNEERKRQVVK